MGELEPLAHFMAHPQSITIKAIAMKKHSQLAAAYDNAKAHYYRQPRSERARNTVMRISDYVCWQIASGSVVKRGLRACKRFLMRRFPFAS